MVVGLSGFPKKRAALEPRNFSIISLFATLRMTTCSIFASFPDWFQRSKALMMLGGKFCRVFFEQ